MVPKYLPRSQLIRVGQLLFKRNIGRREIIYLDFISRNCDKIIKVAAVAEEDKDFLYSKKEKTFADAPQLDFVEVGATLHSRSRHKTKFIPCSFIYFYYHHYYKFITPSLSIRSVKKVLSSSGDEIPPKLALRLSR